jgi:hypothetical protein
MGANKKGKTFGLRNYLAIVLLSIALLIVLFGCAHRPQVKVPPPPRFTEAELGRITVVSACFEPEFKCPHKPLTKGKAAAAGALGGFLGSLLGGAMTGNPLGVAAGVALSPVAAAGCAIYGAIEGETTKTISKTEETLNHSVTHLETQKVMQDQVLSLVRERTRYTFVIEDQSGPKFLDEKMIYDSLKGKGVDTVFEVSVREIVLDTKKNGIDPPLSLFMTASIRLIRVKDDTVLSSHTFAYESREKRKFTKWAKEGAQPFREELDRCFKNLAERIVVELFIS